MSLCAEDTDDAEASPRRIDLTGLLERIFTRITASALEPRDIRLILSADALDLDIGCAWRVAMLLTALVEDTTRVGFHDRGGIILIEASIIDGVLTCCLSDNGGRICTAREARPAPLVRRLTADLRATVAQRRSPHGGATLLRLALRASEQSCER